MVYRFLVYKDRPKYDDVDDDDDYISHHPYHRDKNSAAINNRYLDFV